MDGTSPGNMPISLGAGAVWSGETRWAGADGAGPGVQSCIIDWPTTPWQPWISPHAPSTVPVVPQQHTHYHFTPTAPPLSDADVERIARRVTELLKGMP